MIRSAAVWVCAVALAGCGNSSKGEDTGEATGNMALAWETRPETRDAEILAEEAGGEHLGVLIDYDGTPVEVRYRRVGALGVTGGDMIVGRHDELQTRLGLLQDARDGEVGDANLPEPERRILQQYARRLARAGEGGTAARLSPQEIQAFGWGTRGRTWPGRMIPYEIGPSIPPGPRRDAIVAAVALWNHSSPITLRLAIQIPPSERINTAILTFVDHEAPDNEFACASWVGYQPSGGRQEIYINPTCGPGNIAHEIGHATGLHHEHQRTDRTAFLAISGNIPDDSVNYGTLRGRRLSNHDLCSIMHYGATTTTPRWFNLTSAGQQAYVICEQSLAPTCRRGQPGQRCQLSAGDVVSLRSLYGG